MDFGNLGAQGQVGPGGGEAEGPRACETEPPVQPPGGDPDPGSLGDHGVYRAYMGSLLKSY